jgi:hypothetical protein
MAISRDLAGLITELNHIFTVFDRIIDLFDCERIRTFGDAYMAVSGLPGQNPEHAHNIARVALRMMRNIERYNSTHPEAWHARIGINSGPGIGSLVGVQKYVYDIFGPGVMEATIQKIYPFSHNETPAGHTYPAVNILGKKEEELRQESARLRASWARNSARN